MGPSTDKGQKPLSRNRNRMSKRKEKWIKGAIEHPGELRRYAKRHHELLSNGKINVDEIIRREHTKGRKGSHIDRAAHLAKNLESF